jgi:hypothetical protein
MSIVAVNSIAAPAFDSAAAFSGNSTLNDVVEVGLLLPTDWMADLVVLARKRQQSVGELLRNCIGRALTETDSIE